MTGSDRPSGESDRPSGGTEQTAKMVELMWHHMTGGDNVE